MGLDRIGYLSLAKKLIVFAIHLSSEVSQRVAMSNESNVKRAAIDRPLNTGYKATQALS